MSETDVRNTRILQEENVCDKEVPKTKCILSHIRWICERRLSAFKDIFRVGPKGGWVNNRRDIVEM